MREEIVFGFDLGTASQASAVRKGNEVIEAESFLMPEEFASTKDAAKRRSANRVRRAHRAREERLISLCRHAGIEVLASRAPDGTPGDPRLEREFAEKGDSTCYTSCLLRIKLLRGEPLDGWQVYKALHSAIQRRGYDKNIPWKEREHTTEEKDDAKKTASRLEETEKHLKEMTESPECRYPCYFDAWKMGLWDSQTNTLKDRIDHKAERARNFIMPREVLESEIRQLINQARKLYPEFPDADYVLYGKPRKAYASWYANQRKKFGIKQGAVSDWNGVLGQKIPRFDNRIINKCALISRLNVCKADDPLTWHVTFLMKLLNMRVMEKRHQRQLTPSEVQAWFNTKTSEAIKKRNQLKEKNCRDRQAEKLCNVWKITKTQWSRWCERNGLLALANHEVVESPRCGGRSRFSRPALRLLRELILSGQQPLSFFNQVLKELPKGLRSEDLDFLKLMPNAWEKICIPDRRDFVRVAAPEERDREIKKIINDPNNPVVRHRLKIFHERLLDMVSRHGEPNFVVLEFVREDFMGDKAKKKLEAFQKQRRRERKEARKNADIHGHFGQGALLKMELLKQQCGICLYTGKPLIEENIEEYDIDHIVPQGRKHNGSDSMFNKILTTTRTNRQDKGERYPYEWLAASGNWEAYQARVKAREKQLGRKKATLLLSEDAPELDERYTGLAETAWIAKLTQQIVCLQFGWPLGVRGSAKRVIVVSGGLVGRIRRKYKLNSILSDVSDSERQEKKNRKDPRHHALDAMVICYLPNWARDPDKTNFFRFPIGIHRDYFAQKIESVIPRFICRQKPKLEEMIYRKKTCKGQAVAIRRVELSSLPGEGRNFKVKTGIKKAVNILDPLIQEDVLRFLGSSKELTEQQWKAFCEKYISKNGTAVKKVALKYGSLDEYKDISKDHRGQYRRGEKHQGYFLYEDKENQKPSVKPVYAWASVYKTRQELEAQGHRIIEFLYSNCMIKILSDMNVERKGGKQEHIPAGTYRCSTIQNAAKAILKTASGEDRLVNIKYLIAAGVQRTG